MTVPDADDAAGVLLGLACGDALGRPVEFESATAIQQAHGRLTEMVGNGTWGQPAGTVTDDTDQALCLARSLVEAERFDPEDIATRFVRWKESGPFDIGNMTRRSLSRLQDGAAWDEAGITVWEKSPEGQNAGNGSVMRCPPVAIAYAAYPHALVRTSLDSSWITHADPRCTYGCAVVNLTIAGLLQDVETPLERALSLLTASGPAGPDRPFGRVPAEAAGQLEGSLPREVVTALSDVPDDVDEGTLASTGYVVDTVQTALHDALSANSAEEAIVTAVNRGGDTDTVGAVAGARFGAQDLPDRWLAEIEEEEELRDLATGLREFHPSC